MPIVDPRIAAYGRAHTTPLDAGLDAVAAATRAEMAHPGMMSGLVEARLLQALAVAGGATRVLEVGTFTGFGALALAAVLPEHGRVTTIEADPENAAVARRNLDESPYGARVELLEGDARELLAGLPGPFDLAYVDAWKPDYPTYYEAVLPLLGPRGVMVFDNVLRSGSALEPGDPVGAFNDRVQADPRVANALLTVGDGLLVVWRLL
jgi:predicted O-methyltransferase YrrM